MVEYVYIIYVQKVSPPEVSHFEINESKSSRKLIRMIKTVITLWFKTSSEKTGIIT